MYCPELDDAAEFVFLIVVGIVTHPVGLIVDVPTMSMCAPGRIGIEVDEEDDGGHMLLAGSQVQRRPQRLRDVVVRRGAVLPAARPWLYNCAARWPQRGMSVQVRVEIG